ncbi:unnamed protein product, partial [Prorocentrum cordatum]
AEDDDGMVALEHVPPEDMMTSAEKSLWKGILGRRPTEPPCRNEEPEVSPEPEVCGREPPADLLDADCYTGPGAGGDPRLPGQLEQQPPLMD